MPTAGELLDQFLAGLPGGPPGPVGPQGPQGVPGPQGPGGGTAAPYVFSPEDFGPVGEGDDTAAWNGALDAVRQYNDGFGGGIIVPQRQWYEVGALNATGIFNLEIRAPLGFRFYACKQTIAAPVLDLTGCNNSVIENVVVVSTHINNQPVAVRPKGAFLWAETAAHGDSNKNRMDNCGSIGPFASAPLSIVGSTDNAFYSCAFQQQDPSVPCLTISLEPDWYLNSLFQTLPTRASNVGDQTFVGCEFHGVFQTPPVGSYWTSYFRDADNVRFFGGNHACSGGYAHMLFQGNNKRITSIGQKFYSDSGVPAQYLFQTDSGSCENLCLINPNKADAAFSAGVLNGNFPGFREL